MKAFTTPIPSTLPQQTECIRTECIQTECISPKTAIKIALSQFIDWALRVTASGECTGDRAIALLDQAWAAQKLLWNLRD